MPHFVYRLRQDTVLDEEEKSHLVFGVDLVTPQGENEASFPDLFSDPKKAKDFVLLCNKGQLSPMHLFDVIEDFLGTN